MVVAVCGRERSARQGQEGWSLYREWSLNGSWQWTQSFVAIERWPDQAAMERWPDQVAMERWLDQAAIER